MNNKKLKVLLIEDDQIEVIKLKRALGKLGMEHQLIEAANGEEALEVLKGNEARPDIVFLDLNMPKINGLEFLKILKNDDVFRYLPVIILTTSVNRKDILECYRIGIAGYILKPLKYEEYVHKIGRTLDYWSVNELIK